MEKDLIKKNYQPDEIDLADIIRQLWVKRKFIMIVTFIFLLIGIFVAMVSPVSYTAESTIVSQSSNSGRSGNLGSLASIVGVNLGTQVITDETISPSMYPQIIDSYPFIKEIMGTPINVEKSEEDPISLFTYYTDKKYREFNLLNSIKKYTIGLPGVIVSSLQPNNTDVKTTIVSDKVNDSISILRITPQEQSVYNTIKNSINYESKGGAIKIGYTFTEPLATAQVAEQLKHTLEKYVTNYKLEKVQKNLEFVEMSYHEARKDFIQKQANLAAFQDANRGLTTASAKTMETRLQSEYQISFTIYNELAKQREQAKLTVKETKPVLTVINPVIVPLERSAPARAKIIAIYFMLGLVLSFVWVLGKPFVQNIFQDTQNK